jgi:hypothetical protein
MEAVEILDWILSQWEVMLIVDVDSGAVSV